MLLAELQRHEFADQQRCGIEHLLFVLRMQVSSSAKSFVFRMATLLRCRAQFLQRADDLLVLRQHGRKLLHEDAAMRLPR